MRNDYPDIIGKIIHVRIDRPAGSRHPRYPDMVYNVNYGFAENVSAEDGEEQDIYLLGPDGPAEQAEGRVIAVYRRADDIEDKWIVAADDREFSDEEILRQIQFQEQYFPGKLLR